MASVIFYRSRRVCAFRRITFSTGDLVALRLFDASVVILASSLPLRMPLSRSVSESRLKVKVKSDRIDLNSDNGISNIGSFDGDTSALGDVVPKVFMPAKAISDIRIAPFSGILVRCFEHLIQNRFFITIKAAMILLLCIKSIRCGKAYSSVVFFSGVIGAKNS